MYSRFILAISLDALPSPRGMQFSLCFWSTGSGTIFLHQRQSTVATSVQDTHGTGASLQFTQRTSFFMFTKQEMSCASRALTGGSDACRFMPLNISPPIVGVYLWAKSPASVHLFGIFYESFGSPPYGPRHTHRCLLFLSCLCVCARVVFLSSHRYLHLPTDHSDCTPV